MKQKLRKGLWMLSVTLTAGAISAVTMAGCQTTPMLRPAPPPADAILTSPAPLPGRGTSDHDGPKFGQITTSSGSFVKSDCIPTAITVTATISDPAGVGTVVLLHRVGADQPFAQRSMSIVRAGTYVASVKGVEVPGSAYGEWEFYVTARDGLGNQSQSPVDRSVQLLPCVN